MRDEASQNLRTWRNMAAPSQYNGGMKNSEISMKCHEIFDIATVLMAELDDVQRFLVVATVQAIADKAGEERLKARQDKLPTMDEYLTLQSAREGW